ncbi:MAG: TonB-dependent receptor plug domain-containing protein [Steroidobacteraceae bacterium]
MSLKMTRILTVTLVAFSYVGVTSAQQVATAELAGNPVTNVVTYDQEFFARYSLNTAEDLLRRIPGVSSVLDGSSNQQDRGFGSGGSQILIGGRRFPGKSNEITTTLRRIAAANVERVELIRGSSSEVDVQSTGVVVNLIMRPGASLSGLGSWEINGRFNDAGWFGLDGLFSYSKTNGPLTYLIGIERNLWSPSNLELYRWTNRTRAEAYYYPTGQLQELRPQKWDRDHDKWIYTGSVVYDLANGDRANLNLLYQTLNRTERSETPLIRYDINGNETLRADEVSVRDVDTKKTLEIGGEYTSNIGPGGLLALFIVRRDNAPQLDYRNRSEPTIYREVSRSFSRITESEDILRVSYTLPLGKNQSLELGGEVANNKLEQELQAYLDLTNDGTLEQIVIPTANPQVQEARGEVFANHKWTITDKLSLDSSLNYEFSKLTTNYPLQPTRNLSFVKPRLDARYKVSSSDQMRLLLERTVSQLDFANFVPSYNAVDDRIVAGNPALEPEKIWTAELGYERQLAQDGGVLEAAIFYSDITDAIDYVPLLDADGFLTSASGNIDKASSYGIEIKASVRLGFIGLRDAVLSMGALRRWSDITDPFTQQTRTIGQDQIYNYDIGFRHDITQLGTSYGFNYENKGRESIDSNLLVTQYLAIKPTLTAFIERKLSANLTLRFEAENLTGSPEIQRRIQYQVNAIDGVVRRLDYSREERDRRAALRLRGRF